MHILRFTIVVIFIFELQPRTSRIVSQYAVALYTFFYIFMNGIHENRNKTHTFSLARPACFCTDLANREPLLSAILPNDSMRLIATSVDS